MAAKKTTTGTATRSEQTEPMFSKEQILASNKYYNRHDVINALWTDGSEKSIEEVDDMIEKFMKGMVK